jgi:hypothetical protein
LSLCGGGKFWPAVMLWHTVPMVYLSGGVDDAVRNTVAWVANLACGCTGKGFAPLEALGRRNKPVMGVYGATSIHVGTVAVDTKSLLSTSPTSGSSAHNA